ncbi:hypothetical protein HYPSUDRAFT_203946 [Hypholoma sublateritium FD-334 SS-4]|uniref:SGNH hydrolase-type esterase domain-containing protein n=1 Tax=Hypholoma sublateritium (strain FD-334 SS-4) TaxID=945553 RepID=A0A0D2NN57_HYPSF|nr:hypothetical protein HYPSUDRAFT_203946 [Hypholoma sublateritium FD-334 SS-4]
MAAPIQDVFMLFGDSITQGGWEPGLNGFGQRLTHVYARRLDVLNRGFSGYNTTWGMPVFEQCIAKASDKYAPRLRMLAIWFGANDACIKPSPQHVPLATFAANLKQMVDMIKSPKSEYYSPTTRIILISPPPVNTHARKAALAEREPPMALDREFDITRAYADAVRDVAAAEGVIFADVWTAIYEAADKDEVKLDKFLGDGLHLNENGYDVMYKTLIDTIGKECPEVHYANIGPVFPPWVAIDLENPAKSLNLAKGET